MENKLSSYGEKLNGITGETENRACKTEEVSFKSDNEDPKVRIPYRIIIIIIIISV